MRAATGRSAGPRTRLADALGRWTCRLAACLALLLLAACSSVRLGYANADTLLVRALDSYFDLDDAQTRLARDEVRALLAWHRATELEQYARLLGDAGRRVEGAVSAHEVLALHEGINQRLALVGERAAPALAELALTLRPAQLEHLARKLAKDTARARRELPPADSPRALDARVERYAERLESWLGGLSETQRARLRAALADDPASPHWWLGEREQRERDLVTLLRRVAAEQPPAAVASAWLRTFFAEQRLPADAERRARILDFRRDNSALLAELLNSASPRQKSRLVRRLRDYADDFTALAADAG
ncbi:MAG: DUF6279 family lipoprotein [Gammaproteobacteria bacterium]